MTNYKALHSYLKPIGTLTMPSIDVRREMTTDGHMDPYSTILASVRRYER